MSCCYGKWISGRPSWRCQVTITTLKRILFLEQHVLTCFILFIPQFSIDSIVFLTCKTIHEDPAMEAMKHRHWRPLPELLWDINQCSITRDGFKAPWKIQPWYHHNEHDNVSNVNISHELRIVSAWSAFGTVFNSPLANEHIPRWRRTRR